MANIVWRMTEDTYKDYINILHQMMEAAQTYNQLRYEELKDRFRSLPGFPQGIDPDEDRVVPEIIREIYH
jgi:hypothetical protein